MQLTLNEKEIKTAVVDFLQKTFIQKINSDINIEFNVSRGDGIKANIDISSKDDGKSSFISWENTTNNIKENDCGSFTDAEIKEEKKPEEPEQKVKQQTEPDTSITSEKLFNSEEQSELVSNKKSLFGN